MKLFNFDAALDWWTGISDEEKTRWLQCEATAAEIDAELRTGEPDMRLAAIAAVTDAFAASIKSITFDSEDPV